MAKIAKVSADANEENDCHQSGIRIWNYLASPDAVSVYWGFSTAAWWVDLNSFKAELEELKGNYVCYVMKGHDHSGIFVKLGGR